MNTQTIQMLQLNYNNQSTSTVPIRISSITRFITTMSLHNNSLKKILKLLVTKLQTQYSNIHNYTNTHVITYSSNAILEKITHKIQQKSRIRHNISKLYYSITICTKYVQNTTLEKYTILGKIQNS